MFAVPSQQPAASVAADGPALDHLASSTLLSNVCHVMDVAAIAWRAYRFPSTHTLCHALSVQPPAHTAGGSNPVVLAQHALRSVWGSTAAASEGVCYSVQLDGPGRVSPLLIFVCHIRATASEAVKLLPGEKKLSQYAADADELCTPLSFSARLFSAAFSASVLSLVSSALCDTVNDQRNAAASTTPSSSPAMRFMLLGGCLCAAILPASSLPSPPSKRPTTAVAPIAAAPHSVPSAGATQPATSGAVLPSIVSPYAYLSPPDTGQSSLPSPDPSEAADMIDDTPAATLVSHSPEPLITSHTKAASHTAAPLLCSLPPAADTDNGSLPPLPPYLARFAHTHQNGFASRSHRIHQSSLGRSEERVVQLKPDVLADLALSVNTFPSLSSLSSSTRRSLAIVSADDSTASNASSTKSTAAYTLHSADPYQLLGPPPLSAVASSALSPNTPGSMPALSPLAEDDGKLSPQTADNTMSTAPIEAVLQLPFSPWILDTSPLASDAMETGGDVVGPPHLTLHFIRFIKQQTLAPFHSTLLLRAASATVRSICRPSSHWSSVQRWLSGCSVLTRSWSQSRPFPLFAKQLSLPALEQRTQPLSLHDSPASSISSLAPSFALSLVSLPPSRLVFSFETELRDVPASAVSLYTQCSLRPAITAKDAVYAIVLPANDTAADDKRVDVWFDAFSAAYENGGLGRHRPLNGHGRSGVLKLKSIYDVLRERAEALVSAPATPASPADSSALSNAASPRAGSSSMIVLSSEEPTTLRFTLPLSKALAIHNSAAPDGMRRYYQSIVAALIAELEGISKGQSGEQLDHFDALVLYIVVDDKLPAPHDVGHMSDYLACLYFDRHSDSSFAAALSQLEQMDVVVRLLPSSVLSSFSSASFTYLSLSVHSSIRRMLDRVDSDSDVELPKHVEQLYEPATFVASKRLEGKDDAMVETASGTCTVLCVWTLVVGRLLACACDERGQLLESFVCEHTGTATADVRQCWAQCVLTVWTMARRHRQVQQFNVVLIQWMDEATSALMSAEYEMEWRRMLTVLASPDQPAALLSTKTESADARGTASTQPRCVTVCTLSRDGAFSVLALRDTATTFATTTASSSSTSTTRQPLVVEGINSTSTLASQFLPLPPHTVCSPAHYRVPLAAGLLFSHRAADMFRSALARPLPAPLPAYTGTPLLLSLYAQLAGTSSAVAAMSTAPPMPSDARLLLTVAEQLQQLSFLNLPALSTVDECGGEMEGEADSSAVPLPVCIVQRLTRLLLSCRAA